MTTRRTTEQCLTDGHVVVAVWADYNRYSVTLEEGTVMVSTTVSSSMDDSTDTELYCTDDSHGETAGGIWYTPSWPESFDYA